jgi:hypothetical protein
MSRLGRTGVRFVACLLASVIPSSTVQANDKAIAFDCRILDARLAKSYCAQLGAIRVAMEQDFEGRLCRVAQI